MESNHHLWLFRPAFQPLNYTSSQALGRTVDIDIIFESTWKNYSEGRVDVYQPSIWFLEILFTICFGGSTLVSSHLLVWIFTTIKASGWSYMKSFIAIYVPSTVAISRIFGTILSTTLVADLLTLNSGVLVFINYSIPSPISITALFSTALLCGIIKTMILTIQVLFLVTAVFM